MPAPTVIILAAGEGTRMRSATPKVLHPLCGRPLVHWPIAAAQTAGAARIVVVDGPNEHLEDALPDGVERVIQPVANGTGGAVQAAAEHIEPGSVVVVLLGDAPLVPASLVQALAQAQGEAGAGAVMATMVLEDPGQYGRVVRQPDGTVDRIVEAKDNPEATEEILAIDEVNTGIFAFAGGPLLEALQTLTPDNSQGELFLPDVLPALAAQGHKVLAHVVDDPAVTLGVNDRVDLATVTAHAQRILLEAHMRNGVTIVAPHATTIDADVTIGQDTVIEPGSAIKGTTQIGAGCTVGPHTTLIDTTVGDDVTLIHSYATGAQVDAGATVGPFAYLRPGAHLHAKAKAGTFVEIKNSEIGEGAKVPHLSYIGDADVGEGSNLGAGTITANYDGFDKHRTTIGRNVRISVDTALVAPVEIGDDAYTAAGSVITEDVPPGALGVARERQTNVEGYAERKRSRKDR